jgi:hypothetical protein
MLAAGGPWMKSSAADPPRGRWGPACRAMPARLLGLPHLLHRRGELLERLLNLAGAPHGHGTWLV